MAEFCLDCWNKINDSKDSEKNYIISKDLYLCEGCGEWKPIIIMERRPYYIGKFRYLIFPIRIIYYVICFLCRLLILPYLIFEYDKSKREQNK